MNTINIVLITSGILAVFFLLMALLKSKQYIQENFLDSLLGLNKSVGKLTKNNKIKTNNISDKMNNFLSDQNSNDSMNDISKKIKDLKEQIKNNKTKIVTKKEVEETDKKNIIKIKNNNKNKKPEAFMTPSKLGAMGTCRFLSSDTCSKEYPVYMGASLGVPDDSGMKLKCNSDLMKPAKGLAIIKNGKLEAIVMLDKGEGYKTPPSITIAGGGGKSGKCQSYIDELGSINRIQITNSGYNYTGTPKVNIELPSTSSSCFLCCKKMY